MGCYSWFIINDLLVNMLVLFTTIFIKNISVQSMGFKILVRLSVPLNLSQEVQLLLRYVQGCPLSLTKLTKPKGTVPHLKLVGMSPYSLLLPRGATLLEIWDTYSGVPSVMRYNSVLETCRCVPFSNVSQTLKSHGSLSVLEVFAVHLPRGLGVMEYPTRERGVWEPSSGKSSILVWYKNPNYVPMRTVWETLPYS